MRDVARVVPSSAPEDAFAMAARMSRAAALMAGRLAELLARSPMLDGPVAQGRAFLSAMFDAQADEPPTLGDGHPLDRISAQVLLTPAEIDLIVLAGMAEEHEGYASVLRSLNPRSEPHATVGLAAQLTCDGMRERVELRRLLERGAAVRAGVLTVAGDAPFFERNLVLADGLWPVLCGIDVRPPGVRMVSVPASAAGLDDWLASAGVGVAIRALEDGDPCAIFIVGDTEANAAARAASLAAACGLPWVVFEYGAGTAPDADRLALLHALARGALPIFTIVAGDGPGPSPLPRIEACSGPVVLCARRGIAEPATRLPVIVVDAAPLTATARARMWRDMLPELSMHADTLAVRYAVEPPLVADVARDLRARLATGGAMDLQAVAECVRVRSNRSLGAGVKVVRPTATWDHLVLPPDRKALLVEALNRLTHQATVLDRWRFLSGRPGARGVRVLLSGPPGTGKTLSAEVLASSVGVDLMIVDISRVVSKWIGETEKHLSQAFDAAERAQAILLFDEADALFGKRTDVSDAHDRYANLETAYLLSRLERFEGLAILSTNLKQNIDPAFLRRLEFAIDFDEPSATEREALWRCHLPAEAPLAPDVDLRELAALYPMVGGLIRNASVAAGFLAAAAGVAIGRHHLIGAIRREYEKAAKAFPGVPADIVPA